MRLLATLCCAASVVVFVAPAHAAWPAVPPMDWSKVSIDDFDDAELDVPVLLHHFAQVANAVVEEGPNRGFFAIKVNREPKDNEPYNARIQENALSLAYFYTTKRPWNPYHGSDAVRVRLEAMMDFWCRIQHPESGLFSEYGPTNFSLAPTGFGIMHMARTLELLNAKGGPKVDQAIFDRTLAAQRKAIMAMLTRDDVFGWGSGWSNQWSGTLLAASTYLTMRPDDAEMRAAFLPAVERAAKTFQSPAGYLYESNGPDIGYSGVHENNVRVAWQKLAAFQEVRAAIVAEDDRYVRFVAHQSVPQPGTNLLFTNAGVDTRTQHSQQGPKIRPIAELSQLSRGLTTTTDELASENKRKREALRANWPNFQPLTIPSAYAYQPGPLFTAVKGYVPWTPSIAERNAARANWPCNDASPFTRVAHDGKHNAGFVYVNRPAAYYAVFNYGKPAKPQTFGVGLVWNNDFGVALQTVAMSEWKLGTVVGEQLVREQQPLYPKWTIAGAAVGEPAAGYADLPAGDAVATYDLPGGGSKSIAFSADRITVTVTAKGAIVERLPLLLAKGDDAKSAGNELVVVRRGHKFVVRADGATLTLGKPSPVSKTSDDFSRAELRLDAKDRLTYTLLFEPTK